MSELGDGRTGELPDFGPGAMDKAKPAPAPDPDSLLNEEIGFPSLGGKFVHDVVAEPDNR
jgi:hypothetical protein